MMHVRSRGTLLFAALAGALALSAPVAHAALPSATSVLKGACALDLRAGFRHCNLQLLGDRAGKPLAAAAPSGYGPTDLQSAYGVAAAAAAAGGAQTVAIVDAYDDSTAEADLGTYRTTYGLPTCT